MADETQNRSKATPNHPPKIRRRITLVEWFVIAGMICFVVALLIPPSGGHTREHEEGIQCTSNLIQIGIALHNYHDTYGSLPPAYTVDSQGNRLHSWRTLLLPMMDQRELYEKIDLSKPWDDPVNAEARNKKWDRFSSFSYRCPASKAPETRTQYQVVISPHGMSYQNKTCQLDDVTDGTANTLMVVEVPADQAVHWMSPYDINEQVFQSINDQSLFSHKGMFYILRADGAIKSLTPELTAAERRALVTIAGNDVQEEKND